MNLRIIIAITLVAMGVLGVIAFYAKNIENTASLRLQKPALEELKPITPPSSEVTPLE